MGSSDESFIYILVNWFVFELTFSANGNFINGRNPDHIYMKKNIIHSIGCEKRIYESRVKR